MGFFSKLFTTVFQPVTQVYNAANMIANTATAAVDGTVHTVATALAPIPVVGSVMDNVSHAVSNATDIADTAVSYGNQTVGNVGYLGSDTLDFNFANVGGDISYQLNTTGTLVGTVFNQVDHTVTSIFDFS